ncbi:F0F1 ATP synthase subunit B family protein [Helicobacter sp. 23-1044]
MGISLNPQLMALVFVLFILSIYLLNKWLYQPILAFMDARDAMIKNDLDNASGNESEIAHIDSQIQAILDSAKKEAFSIKEKATLEAKADSANNIEQLKTENDRKLVAFLEALNSEKKSAKSALLSQIPAFQNALNDKIKSM